MRDSVLLSIKAAVGDYVLRFGEDRIKEFLVTLTPEAYDELFESGARQVGIETATVMLHRFELPVEKRLQAVPVKVYVLI